MTSRWREHSNAVIWKAYQELQQSDPDMPIDKLCKKISRDYYPFYEREMHPYKIWLSAIKQFKARLEGNERIDAHNKRVKAMQSDPNQQKLF